MTATATATEAIAESGSSKDGARRRTIREHKNTANNNATTGMSSTPLVILAWALTAAIRHLESVGLVQADAPHDLRRLQGKCLSPGSPSDTRR